MTPDSAQGVLAVTGAQPFTAVVLRPSGGGAPLRLTGPRTRALARLAGLEVWVRGTPAPRSRLEVAEFAVRAAGGRPAVDGRLEHDGGCYYLRLADGSRQPVARLPAALGAHVGERVYLVGDAGGAPEAFGVIGTE